MQINDLFSDAEISQLETTGALDVLSENMESEETPKEETPVTASETVSEEPKAPSELEVLKQELENAKAKMAEKDTKLAELSGKIDLLISSAEKSQAPRGEETPEVDMLAILTDSQKAPQFVRFVARQEFAELMRPVLPMLQILAEGLDEAKFSADKPDYKDMKATMKDIQKEYPELRLTNEQAYKLAKKLKTAETSIQPKTEKPQIQTQTKTQVSLEALKQKARLNTENGIRPSNGSGAEPQSLRQILEQISLEEDS